KTSQSGISPASLVTVFSSSPAAFHDSWHRRRVSVCVRHVEARRETLKVQIFHRDAAVGSDFTREIADAA
ncbi:MAG: hypothetical protein AAF334_01600, partial [Pseudomonadota bacterium]